MRCIIPGLTFFICCFSTIGCEEANKVQGFSKSDLPAGFGEAYLNQHPIERTYVNVMDGYFHPANKNEADLYYAAHQLKNFTINNGFTSSVNRSADSLMTSAEGTSAVKVVRQVVAQIMLNSYLYYGHTAKDFSDFERYFKILIKNDCVNYELLYKTYYILKKSKGTESIYKYVVNAKSINVASRYIEYMNSGEEEYLSVPGSSFNSEDSISKEVYSQIARRTKMNIDYAKLWLKEFK